MAFEKPVNSVTVASTQDNSSNQFQIVAGTTSGGATVVATRGGSLLGVLDSNSTGTGGGGDRVIVEGIARVNAGDSSGMGNEISLGTIVVASSQGAAVPSTGAGQHVLGKALQVLSTGSTGRIAVLITHGIST